MKINVIGLGKTRHTANKLGGVMMSVGVNDIFRYCYVDHVVILDYPSRFTPERLDVIKKSTPLSVITHIAEWQKYFSNVQVIKLAKFRGDISELDTLAYPYSISSPYVACVHAYKLGASEIIMHGVDYTEHPTLSESDKLKTTKRNFYDLFVALQKRGVGLFVSSNGSALSSVIPVYTER